MIINLYKFNETKRVEFYIHILLLILKEKKLIDRLIGNYLPSILIKCKNYLEKVNSLSSSQQTGIRSDRTIDAWGPVPFLHRGCLIFNMCSHAPLFSSRILRIGVCVLRSPRDGRRKTVSVYVVRPLSNLHNLPERWQTERATMQD